MAPGPVLQCSFRGPNSVDVSDEVLRKAIAKAASSEHARWVRRKEDDPAVFPSLVCTWLAGLNSSLEPNALAALQSAAMTLAYENLGNNSLNTAIQSFNAVDATYESAVDEVYERSRAVDDARRRLAPLQAEVNTALQKEQSSKQAVSQAKKNVADAAKATPVDSVRLGAASESLNDAEQEHQKNVTARKNAETARDNGKKKLEDASKELEKAHRAEAKAKAARKAAAGKASNWIAVKKAVDALLKAGKIKASTTLRSFVEEALRAAHNSRADVEPWSAAFVGARIRSAAIDLGLEARVGGIHHGKDGLLKITRRHSDYIIDARKPAKARYQAFAPGTRAVELGDILCTDRADFRTKSGIQTLKGLRSGAALHGDLVVKLEVGQHPYAETIGGTSGKPCAGAAIHSTRTAS